MSTRMASILINPHMFAWSQQLFQWMVAINHQYSVHCIYTPVPFSVTAFDPIYYNYIQDVAYYIGNISESNVEPFIKQSNQKKGILLHECDLTNC